jgi:hypothetical protein
MSESKWSASAASAWLDVFSAVEHACPEEIDDDGERDHGEGPWRCLHLRRLDTHKPFNRLPTHHAGKNEQHRRLDKCGNALDFAMAVMMLGIGRLARNPHGEIGDHGGAEVGQRMGRLGEERE